MKIDKDFLGPSRLALALTAALALVASTVTVWGVISNSGKVQRQNIDLALTLSRMAPEPLWDAGLSRDDLERSLKAALPNLSADAQVCFAAPEWAIVHDANVSLLLKWTHVDGGFAWQELDRAER